MNPAKMEGESDKLDKPVKPKKVKTPEQIDRERIRYQQFQMTRKLRLY